MWTLRVASSALTLPGVAARARTSRSTSNIASAAAQAPSMPGSVMRMTLLAMLKGPSRWPSFRARAADEVFQNAGGAPGLDRVPRQRHALGQAADALRGQERGSRVCQ